MSHVAGVFRLVVLPLVHLIPFSSRKQACCTNIERHLMVGRVVQVKKDAMFVAQFVEHSSYGGR